MPEGRRPDWFAVQLLLRDVAERYRAGRYAAAKAVALDAKAAAAAVADLALEVRARHDLAATLVKCDEPAAALTELTWIMAIANDAQHREALERGDAAWTIASAYDAWVNAAQQVPSIPKVDLLQVLDAGEVYVRSIGKPNWRAGLVHERGHVLDTLDRGAEALSAFEEALALAERNEDGPGKPLCGHLLCLADMHGKQGNIERAESLYRRLLAEESSRPAHKVWALLGLGRCALQRGDGAVARAAALEAIDEEAALEGRAPINGLSLLVDACRKLEDREAARDAADRHLAAAREQGDDAEQYGALCDAIDVALDDRRIEDARSYLGEIAATVELLDRQAGGATFAEKILERRARLAALERGE